MRDIFDIKDNFQPYKDTASELVLGDYTHCPVPTVSILMPVYKHVDYLGIALKSALDQDYTDAYEIVIVDNDDTEAAETPNHKIIKELYAPHVFYYRNKKNIGAAGNWNRCIELARAPFLVFCHDDDMLLPNALSRLMCLQKKRGNMAIFSAFNKIDGAGNYLKRKRPGKNILGILKKRDNYPYSLFAQFMNEIGNGVGSLFAKEGILKIGGFDPEFTPTSDEALFVIYAYHFGSWYNGLPTANYRVAENDTFNCYKEVLETDRHIWGGMKKFIHLPDFLLDRIIEAKYNAKKIRYEIEFGGGDSSLKKNLRISDMLLLKVIHWSFFLKRYRLG